MKKRIHVWVISDGKGCAKFMVNLGGFAMPLPLILASRREARQVMKAYPELSPTYSVRKASNEIVFE